MYDAQGILLLLLIGGIAVGFALLQIPQASPTPKIATPIGSPCAPDRDAETVTISVKDIHEERPRFKREYTACLDYRASIKITVQNRWFRNSTDFSGELIQPNGRWILFDPYRIADKIVDPALVPLIQKYVDAIARMDKAFRSPAPTVFTDEGGTVWRRAA